MPEQGTRIRHLLAELYDLKTAETYWRKIQDLLADFNRSRPFIGASQPDAVESEDIFSESDAILITYGDQFRAGERQPLAVLAEFVDTWLDGLVNTVHILPFYPYTSDDGFSVTDYWQVNPAFGSWRDVQRVGQNFRLMFDAVINHISRSSEWFDQYIQGDAYYADFFIEVDPATDLSMTVRPRTLPLLTPVETKRGTRYIWTTFSEDQIDLNYANPEVLLKIIELLLFYISNGAAVIRLDAIAYLWKKPGSSCIHLRETHAVIKIFRAIVDLTKSGTILITETNVPHKENVSYFGERVAESGQYDEAHMVYQFPLAPLVADAFFRENTEKLLSWVATLRPPSLNTTFFNFIASHDGIGVTPARGLLLEEEIDTLVRKTTQHGGQVSYRSNPDGSQSVYELNISLFDLLNNPTNALDQRAVDRFLASQFILLSLAGIPGIYVHSLLGSRNCLPCVAKTGRARSINREKLELEQVDRELRDLSSLRHKIFNGYAQMLKIRRNLPAFRPSSPQRVLALAPEVFGLVRGGEAESPAVVCLANTSGKARSMQIPLRTAGIPNLNSVFLDLFSEQHLHPVEGHLQVDLRPYQHLWLQAREA